MAGWGRQGLLLPPRRQPAGALGPAHVTAALDAESEVAG